MSLRTDAATPARVGSYRIEERLGAGGMGVVYRGFDEALLRPVALKRLLPDRADATTRKRFRREAQAASRLNHPAIVHIYDIVETPDGDWIVMELVEGRPLDDIANTSGELDIQQALRIAREIAEGLAEAHGIGVIHRDLKTSNVMITQSGRAKILDFGIAKLAHGSDDTVLSQAGTIIGTFHAMSPEQAMGRPIDPRSDLFSLGTLLYELLTGTSPFRGSNSTETLARVCSYRQPPAHRLRRDVPQEVSELVDHLLQKDPDLRPRSAQEVAAALDLAARGLLPSTPSQEAPPTWIAPPTFVSPPTLEQTLREGYVPPSVSDSHRTVRERRQVTVACCELTAVREAGGTVAPTVVDPEALAEILPEVKAMAGRVTERFSGQVGDTLGRRMVLCFGYPQAHEDAAARGVRAALDFVAEIERLSSRFETGSEVRLALRAGVHTGTAIVLPGPEPPSLGATLDTAAGLLLHAAPGEVLVSTATHRLLRDAFTTERRPPVEVQGTGETVDAFRVLEAAGPPEPAAAAGPLVGRERELDLLSDLWRRAAEGTGQVALITGEAGLGKSRLLQALREKVGQDAARWLYAYGSPHDQSSPLQPVVNVLRRLVDSQEAGTPLGRVEELLRACSLPPSESVPLFAALLGVPLEEPYRLPPLGPDRIREKTLEAVAALTLEMAERQPLVWVIEDLHWLDPTTMRWLDLLIEQASSVPLFLVLTVRPQTLEGVWSPKGQITQISLAPLAQPDVERLIERLIEGKPGKELSDALRREIVARTDGVPLFVEELTKTVLESGRTGGRPDIPSTLRDSLATRLDRLGDAKGVAQVASVIGRSFSLELLTAVSPLDESALQRELRRLVQAELVFRRGFGSRTSYLFKHALIRDAAYDSLLNRERQQLHLRVAEALERRDQEKPRPEILAYHYAEGNLPEKAVANWLEAAQQALGRSAHLEALHHVRDGLAALASLPPGPARDERELQLQTTLAPAVIATQGFSSPEVERAYLRGLELCGEQQGRFELLYGLFSFYAVQAKPDRALPLAGQMLQIAETQDSTVYKVQSRYGLGAMSFLLGDFAASRRHLSAALAEDDPDLGRLLPLSFGTDDRKTCAVYDALDLWLLGSPDQALERCRTALAWTRETPQPFTLTTVLLLSGFLHRFRRDDDAVRRHAEEMIALSEEHGLFQVRDANVLLGLALSAGTAGDGDPDAGIEHLKASLEAYRATGFRVFLSFYLAELSAACLRRGRLEESEAALQEAFGAVHGGSERFWEPELHRLRGELLALSGGTGATGAMEEAEASFRKALATAAGRSALALELRAAVSLARLWQGQGRRDEARELLSGVYARFNEGLATADLTEAGALLTDVS